MTQPVRREDYRPPSFLVDQAELTLELAPDTTRVTAELALRRNPDAGGDKQELQLDGEQLTLHALRLDGRALHEAEYAVDDSGLTIPDAPDQCRLTTEVSIHPAENTALMGLYQAGELLCTQCEPEAFRRITYYPDRPDVLAPFRVTLIADPTRYPVLLSNGNPVGERMRDDGQREAVWDDPFPKPSYLFAVVAGELTATERGYTTGDGREVTIGVHTAPAYSHRCGHTLATLERAMAWDEHTYGLAYDLDVFNAVAVPQYTQGAMENKGLNIFNDRYALADSETATDRDHRESESMVAHEFFHNWSGNRVTCRDWFQLGLKEGFTTLREQDFIADRGFAAVRRIEDARLMRTRQFAEDAGPLAHAVRPAAYEEIENFYSDTVYSKGAEIFRMLRQLAGPTAFRAGVDRYFQRYDGQAVTIEALVGCIAEAAQSSFEAFMGWFERAGTPSLRVTSHYAADAGVLEIRVRQQPPPGNRQAAPLPMPLTVGLLDNNGTELPVRLSGETDQEAVGGTRTLTIDAADQRFRFSGLHERPILALLRDFAAPVHLVSDRAIADYAVLAAHDPDPVTRWDAVQALVQRCLDARITASCDATSEYRLAAILRGILTEGTGDRGLDALLVALPDAAALLAERPDVGIEALDAAREGLRSQLAEALADELVTAYEANAVPQTPYSADPEAVGQRALRDACLAYLARPDDPDGMERALTQYHQAANLTDAVNALDLIAATDHPQRATVLADFRERHAASPLVLDKWLVVQARSRRADTLERVEALMDDPFFSLEAPNRVRALVETFATANPLRFHRSDGAGYRFLTDQVLALDPANPALAAGLLRHITGWRHHQAERGKAMRWAIERVAGHELSSATREVVNASLAD
jgi:aminopeptidase N